MSEEMNAQNSGQAPEQAPGQETQNASESPEQIAKRAARDRIIRGLIPFVLSGRRPQMIGPEEFDQAVDKLRSPVSAVGDIPAQLERCKDAAETVLPPNERAELEEFVRLVGELETIVKAEAFPLTAVSVINGLRLVVKDVLRIKQTIGIVAQELVAVTADDAQARTLLGLLEDIWTAIGHMPAYQIRCCLADDGETAAHRGSCRDQHAADKAKFAAALEAAGGDFNKAVAPIYLAALNDQGILVETQLDELGIRGDPFFGALFAQPAGAAEPAEAAPAEAEQPKAESDGAGGCCCGKCRAHDQESAQD